jgi:hypothetical protein
MTRWYRGVKFKTIDISERGYCNQSASGAGQASRLFLEQNASDREQTTNRSPTRLG